jgi:hypothetical protein
VQLQDMYSTCVVQTSTNIHSCLQFNKIFLARFSYGIPYKSLHFVRTHTRSPSAATIHSKQQGWRDGDYLAVVASVEQQETKDGGVLSADTSSASHLPPMSMWSQNPQVSVDTAISRRITVACQPSCHDNGAPGGTTPHPSPGWLPQPERTGSG